MVAKKRECIIGIAIYLLEKSFECRDFVALEPNVVVNRLHKSVHTSDIL